MGRHRFGTPTGTSRPTEITTLSLATVDTKPTENTGVLVERLWEASHDSLPDVERWPGPAPRVEAGPGRRRWPWVMAAVSIAAAALAVWALPNAVRDREQATIDEITSAVDEASSDLANANIVSATIIDAAADTATLSGMAADLTRIDTAARELLDQAVAAEDAGISNAAQIGQAGELALSLERRLSTVLTYRLLVESSLSLPELPTAATPEELSEVARSLSEAITSIRGDVASLPRDELLDAHRADTIAAVDLLADDQAAYLAALRDGDASGARILVAGMHGRLAEIRDGLDGLLSSLAPWVADTVMAIDTNLRP